MQAGAESDEPQMQRATVLYDFNAEMENELTITVGEEVVIGAEVDGWYQATRVSDGQSGLIPAAYVKMG